MKLLLLALLVAIVFTQNSDSDGVSWGFIAEKEEGGIPKLDGYVPTQKGKVIDSSGVTVGTGVDLGRNAQAIRDLGLSTELTNKLLPYAGLRGQPALVYHQAHPLKLTAAEVKSLDAAEQKKGLNDVRNHWNRNAGAGAWDKLTGPQKTVLTSLSYQWGTWLENVKNDKIKQMYADMLSGKWDKVQRDLLNDDSKYKNRRRDEGKVLRDKGWTAPVRAVPGARCTALGGACTNACAGKVKTGLCPGSSTCCLAGAGSAPQSVAGPKCSAIGGSCTMSCNGGKITTKLCPGAYTCCVGGKSSSASGSGSIPRAIPVSSGSIPRAIPVGSGSVPRALNGMQEIFNKDCPPGTSTRPNTLAVSRGGKRGGAKACYPCFKNAVVGSVLANKKKEGDALKKDLQKQMDKARKLGLEKQVEADLKRMRKEGAISEKTYRELMRDARGSGSRNRGSPSRGSPSRGSRGRGRSPNSGRGRGMNGSSRNGARHGGRGGRNQSGRQGLGNGRNARGGSSFGRGRSISGTRRGRGVRSTGRNQLGGRTAGRRQNSSRRQSGRYSQRRPRSTSNRRQRFPSNRRTSTNRQPRQNQRGSRSGSRSRRPRGTQRRVRGSGRGSRSPRRPTQRGSRSKRPQKRSRGSRSQRSRQKRPNGRRARGSKSQKRPQRRSRGSKRQQRPRRQRTTGQRRQPRAQRRSTQGRKPRQRRPTSQRRTAQRRTPQRRQSSSSYPQRRQSSSRYPQRRQQSRRYPQRTRQPQRRPTPRRYTPRRQPQRRFRPSYNYYNSRTLEVVDGFDIQPSDDESHMNAPVDVFNKLVDKFGADFSRMGKYLGENEHGPEIADAMSNWFQYLEGSLPSLTVEETSHVESAIRRVIGDDMADSLPVITLNDAADMLGDSDEEIRDRNDALNVINRRISEHEVNQPISPAVKRIKVDVGKLMGEINTSRTSRDQCCSKGNSCCFKKLMHSSGSPLKSLVREMSRRTRKLLRSIENDNNDRRDHAATRRNLRRMFKRLRFTYATL